MDIFPILAAFTGVIVLAALAFLRPGWGLIAAIVVATLLPVELGIEYEELPRIGPTRLLLSAFLVAWVLRAAIARAMGMRDAGPHRKLPMVAIVSVYLATVLACTAVSMMPLRTFLTFVNQAWQFYLPFFVMAVHLRHPEYWSQLKTGIFVLTAVVCLFAFYEAVTAVNPYLKLFEGEEMVFRGGILRVRSTFFHPIALGCFINLVFPFALVDLIQARGLARRLGVMLLIFIMMVTLFMTVSRGPWAVLGLQLVIFTVWWSIRNWSRVVPVYAMSGLMFVALIGTLQLSETVDFGRILNPSGIDFSRVDEASSEYYRIALFRGVVDRMQGGAWVYGLGPGTFHLAGIEARYAGHDHVLTAPDSHYVKMLLEMGILGTAVYALLLLAAVLVCCRAVRRTDGSDRLLAVACLASVVGFIIVNFTVSMLELLPLVLLFWMAVALAASRPDRSGRSGRSAPAARKIAAPHGVRPDPPRQHA